MSNQQLSEITYDIDTFYSKKILKQETYKKFDIKFYFN